jgi:predicted lipoprotein with Yx(FWY)xxD motif
MTGQALSSGRAHLDQDTHQRGTGQARRALFAHLAAATGVVTLALGSLVALAPASAATVMNAADPAYLQAASVGTFGEVLTNSHGVSLYGLSNENGGKLACTGKCLQFWPPALVSTSVMKVSLGAGVTGATGFVTRSATTKQVTFDGYPLYTFIKDTGAGQAHGEGISAFGGTWGLLRASSLIIPAKTASPTTTTTA